MFEKCIIIRDTSYRRSGLILCFVRRLAQMNETYDAYGEGVAQPACYFQKQVRFVWGHVRGQRLNSFVEIVRYHASQLSRIYDALFL